MMSRYVIMCAAMMVAAPAALAQNALDPFALFASADANGDGAVSKSEFLAARTKVFPQIDRNGDGVLTADEFSAQAQGLQGRIMAPRLFANFDLNADGKVTPEEFAKAPAPLFDKADTNHDGVVSKAELDAVRP